MKVRPREVAFRSPLHPLARLSLRAIGLSFLLALTAAAQPDASTEPFRYMTPPAPMVRLLEAPSQPLVLLSPARDTIALLARPGRPLIAELAEPELGLAGQIVNPRNNGPSRTSSYSGVSFQHLADRTDRHASLPTGARVIALLWSPDGRHLAFLLLREEEVELWVAEAATGRARRLAGKVSAALPRAFEWLPDSTALIARVVPPGRGPPPQPARAPAGPIVQENQGRSAPVQTLQNLLSGPYDEALFEHYFTSQLAQVKLDGTTRALGPPGIIADNRVSPNGRYILQHRLKRPFSYSVSASSFPTEILVTDLTGTVVRRLAELPAGETASATAGPRLIRWRDDAPATLAWAEARDGGGDRAEAAVRDRVYLLDAPFTGPPRALLDLEHRFSGILWGRDDFALILATSRQQAREYRIAVDPARAGSARVLQVRAFRGGEQDPGTPLMRVDSTGRELLHFTPDGRGLFMRTRDGLSRLDLATGQMAPLWREQPGESLFALLDRGGERLATWRESRLEPPNLFVTDRRTGSSRQITRFSDPAPELASIQHRTLAYARADGVPLGGTLYLPAGYDSARDGPLPLLIWAYPVSVANAQAIGQPPENTSRFVRPHGFDDLPLLLLTQGYAVFEARMPIVGAAGREPNDTHVAQLVANAEAAVDALVAAGVADRARIAIGGHSYGAAMAANLLARSDLFRTAIALSGAYNRTLTPFGFQASERRTFWQAPDAYMDMSPFAQAHRINEPILLIHGAADANSGTLPMQSERLFAALAGHGATVRYVLLPFEGHTYIARESVMHTMWEMTRWLDLHLRRPPARPEAASD